MSIFDWIGNFVSSACHHDFGQQNQYHRNDALPTVNPTSGLPMIGGSSVDVRGNPFGTDLSSWHRDDTFISHQNDLNHSIAPSCTSPGYDPIRGW
jgi:hypothetical protein